MIPFFVVDRPISLQIIKGSNYEALNCKIGLMSHANTSKNFMNLFKIYPCQEDGNCILASDTNICKYPYGICKRGELVKNYTTKIADSGVFTKDGCKIEKYPDLFRAFDDMGANFGIIKDSLNNKRKTIRSAKKALKIYKKGNYNFNLYGVTQGKTLKEYLRCYEELIKIGYSNIAVGGLLKKIENSARYTKVRNQEEMFDILINIKEKFPIEEYTQSKSIFALGCYHPMRHEKFVNIGLFGADFKGWIFKYKNHIEYANNNEKQTHRINQVRDYLKNEVYSKLIL